VRENLLTLYEAAEHGFSAPLPSFVRAELEAYAWYRRKMRARGSNDGKSGAVTAVQRVSSDFRLNPHFHSLALDGVFVETETGELTFHALLRRKTRTETYWSAITCWPRSFPSVPTRQLRRRSARCSSAG
jgi:Putative transposase